MAGPAATASALPLSAGSPPLRRCNPAAVFSITRPPLLMVAKTQHCVLRRFAPASRRKCVAATGHGSLDLRASQYQCDDYEPLWLAVVRDITWGLRSFVAFLAEQPRQLQHLEWLGFRNALRTATLTLILVAVFIVSLPSVDAALCYICPGCFENQRSLWGIFACFWSLIGSDLFRCQVILFRALMCRRICRRRKHVDFCPRHIFNWTAMRGCGDRRRRRRRLNVSRDEAVGARWFTGASGWRSSLQTPGAQKGQSCLDGIMEHAQENYNFYTAVTVNVAATRYIVYYQNQSFH